MANKRTQNLSEATSNALEQALKSHDGFAQSMESLVQRILLNKKVKFLHINSRTKSKDSAAEKILAKGYRNAELELTDLSGVRIITYFESQVQDICAIIRSTFDVDEENSPDKGDELGSNKIGYRSVHLVCALAEARGNLPEYQNFGRLKFEIQVRTVLQHAWADLAHDNSYKLGAQLPRSIQRKLNLYSGMLEVIDLGFDEIVARIESYKEELARADDVRLSDEEVNSVALHAFLNRWCAEYEIKIRSSPNDDFDQAIKEIINFGISKIHEFSSLFCEQFVAAYRSADWPRSGQSEIGFIRAVLMFSDLRGYFRKTETPLRAISPQVFRFLSKKYDAAELQRNLLTRDIEIMKDNEN